MNYAGLNDRERVLAATDLVALVGEHVQLRRKGREHVGLCPFHDDHTPSMHVVTHKGSHFFKCFACGESGSAIDFVMKFHHMGFAEALRFLAERAGITLEVSRRDESRAANENESASPREALLNANKFALEYFRKALAHDEAGRVARQMLEERGVSAELIERFEIGFAPPAWEGLANLVRRKGLDLRAFRDAGLVKEVASGAGVRDAFVNRIIFPIHDQLGRPIAFGGRRIDPETQPKYLNSAESALFNKSDTLYGLHLARRAISEQSGAIVTEGYTDVVAMHQHGLSNAVATLGTALTLDHGRTLQRLCDSVILLFDGDEAGMKAADRAVEVFFNRDIDVRIAVLPDGKDPDDLLREGDAGRRALEAALDASTPALEFLKRGVRSAINSATTLSGREKVIKEFAARLGTLGYWNMSGIKKREITPDLASFVGIAIREFEKLVPRPRSRPIPSPVNNDPVNEDAPGETEDDGGALLLPRHRRVAEEDLLAVLIFEPQAAIEAVDVGEGHYLPVAEAFSRESFADPVCRAIFDAMVPWLESHERFTVQMLCDRVEGAAVRARVTSLFLRGRDLCNGAEARARIKLADTVEAFHRVRDRDLLNERITQLRTEAEAEAQAGRSALGEIDAPASEIPAFVRVLEERRLHKDDRAVLPRAIRAGA